MRTVSQIVEQVIGRSPFLAEVLEEGIGNNAQIARRIKKEVESILLEEVSDASIAMALHRLRAGSAKPLFGTRFLRHMHDITVRSNLVIFSCSNSSGLLAAFQEISRETKDTDTFLNFSRGLHESILIVSRDFEEAVSLTLKHEKNLTKVANVSAITIRLPEASLAVPGVYYPILKAIALEGISLVEVMSIRTEYSIIFEDKDIDRAFSTIKRVTS